MKFSRQIVFQAESGEQSAFLMHLPYFKLYRCPDDFPQPPAQVGHYPYFLEFSYLPRTGVTGLTEFSYDLGEKPSISNFRLFPIPDNLVESYDRHKAIQTVLNLVNALTNNFFFNYQSRQGWFLDLNEFPPQTRYGQDGYSHEHDISIKEIEAVENYRFFDPVLLVEKDGLGNRFETKLSQLLNIFFTMNDIELQQKYLDCCSILSKAQKLSGVDQAAAYVFLISAIEALIQIEYKDEKIIHCESCGQPMYKVNQKFLNFLDKYCYDIPKKEKDALYRLRSGIVHTGKLMASDGINKMFIENQEDLDLDYQFFNERFQFSKMLSVTKTCFRSFLKKKIGAERG